MRITNGLLRSMSGLARVLEGRTRKSPEKVFLSTLTGVLRASTARDISISAECNPGGPVQWSVSGALLEESALADSATEIAALSKMLQLLHIQAMKSYPYRVKLSQGVLEIDCNTTTTEGTGPIENVTQLMLRATIDLIEDQHPAVINIMLWAQTNPAMPFTIENYATGRLGLLNQAIDGLIFSLDAKVDLFLSARNRKKVTPIFLWTTHPALSARAIKSFVDFQRAPESSSAQTHGLNRFVWGGLFKLPESLFKLSEPLFKKTVQLIRFG